MHLGVDECKLKVNAGAYAKNKRANILQPLALRIQASDAEFLWPDFKKWYDAYGISTASQKLQEQNWEFHLIYQRQNL